MVLWSAEILERSEFQVFEQAYLAWYRETPDTARLERLFAEYMFDGIVPFWVRQFTRMTVESHGNWCRDEALDVREYLFDCLGAASGALCATVGLALSLFLPHMVFPWVDGDFAALPAWSAGLSPVQTGPRDAEPPRPDWLHWRSRRNRQRLINVHSQ